MNIILFLIIFILIVYFIYNNKTIENITNTNKYEVLNTKQHNNQDTKQYDNLDINQYDNIDKYNNNLSTTNFYLSNDDNNINNQKCNDNLSSILKEIKYNDYTFKLIGTAINKFYNQNYYLYERKNDQYGDLLIKDNLDYLDEQIYSYLFVNFIDNKVSIQKEFGPRIKINTGDIIYLDIKDLSNGISYIGPYHIL